ncbi:AbrB/MazE/SpoVT family DNA-binding domain-containing protein [Schinkia azotoformans]|uniref:AbrB/MazE/SpoVT family DNA-binding domain-containing protein n=1 Tax=Schinkia azotoformans TaxID=1454 RepID=UPI002E20642D|nr:AbrB/MazE/SpoVT family DNA-binding domain-containing protein [Schinkia azotoformans]
MNYYTEHFDGLNILENREITVTGKRQITIPKSFYERLSIDKTLQAFLTPDGIYLKPKQNEDESVYDEDIKSIIKKVMSEGYSSEEMVEEIAYRIKKYNEFIDNRIREFEKDLGNESESDDLEDEFNGLDVFFDSEIGKDDQKIK